MLFLYIRENANSKENVNENPSQRALLNEKY